MTVQADCVRPTTFGTDSTTPVTTGVEESFGITPVAGGVGEVVVVGIIILAVVVACMCVHKHKKETKVRQ